jgi:hypothetical protein
MHDSLAKFSSTFPASIGVTGQKLGMNAPISARGLSQELNDFPTSKTFSQQVVTPEGTPLGGSVTLVVNIDGTYTVEFIMHSSSILAAFDFQLRAYLSGSNLPSFFFYHAGHVSPKGTDDTHPEPGTNPLISMYWKQIVEGGNFSVAHDYSWSGAAGTVASLVDDLIDLGAATVGTALGVVIGMTSEALSWLGANLGPGGTIGVIAGVLVFAVGSVAGLGVGQALMLATVAGAATAAIANTLIRYRPMTGPEIDLARKVFGDHIPYDKVQFTNLAGIGGRAFTAPGVDGKTYCNLGVGLDHTLDPAGAGSYHNLGELMIHELTHAWQIAHNSFIPGFMCSGIVNQTNYTMGDDVYAYGPAGPAWSSFNLEQQASIVNNWFAGDGNSRPWGATNTQTNPYAAYIKNNILADAAGFSTAWL